MKNTAPGRFIKARTTQKKASVCKSAKDSAKKTKAKK